MHGCFGEETCEFAIEDGFELLCVRDLLWGGEKEGSFQVKADHFGLEFGEGAATKDDSGRSCVVLKCFHCDFGLSVSRS